jgi:hypothetical protein
LIYIYINIFDQGKQGHLDAPIKVINNVTLKWLVDLNSICKTYVHNFLTSAFASVCLRLEGFNLFYISVPRHLESSSFRVEPLRLPRQISGNRSSSCDIKSNTVFSQEARYKYILSVIFYHNVYSCVRLLVQQLFGIRIDRCDNSL